MSVTKIKNYTQFVNENLGGGLKDFKGKKVFEAEETKKPSEMEIRKAIFDSVAYPTTKETYSKLLSTMTGKDIVGSGNAFNLIRDFIVGLSNEAVKYVQITQGEEENMKKGILTIGVKPLVVNNKKDEYNNLKYKLYIPTNSEELKSSKNILEYSFSVKELDGTHIPLKHALLINSINPEGKYLIAGENPVHPKDILDRGSKSGETESAIKKVLAVWDNSGEIIKRVNNNIEDKQKSALELLASVPTEQKMQVINSYSPFVKNTLSEGIANFKSKESKEVPGNVAPKNIDPNNKEGKGGETNESLTSTRNYNPLNEAKSCKSKVVKFLEGKECTVDYTAGTCKVGTKTMKIEKALLKFEAPESLIKSYVAECEKEVNEALGLMRRR